MPQIDRTPAASTVIHLLEVIKILPLATYSATVFEYWHLLHHAEAILRSLQINCPV